MLVLKSIDANGQHRDFSCQIDKLEVAVDFLNQIVAHGSTLLQATILEDNTRTELPIAVLDGKSCLAGMRDLETEWRSILAASVEAAPPITNDWGRWLGQRVRQYESQLASYKQLQRRLNQLMKRAQQDDDPESGRHRFLGHFAWLLKARQPQHSNAQVRVRSRP